MRREELDRIDSLRAGGSLLREQMINAMIVRYMSVRTIRSYVEAVISLARYYRQSPEKLTPNQVQEYLLYLEKVRRLAWSTINIAFSAFRFLYTQVLDRPDITFSIPPRRTVKRLPLFLSIKDVKHIINAPDNLKHRTFLLTVYGCGLRVSEAVRLKPRHIESSPERMLMRVEQGKGRKDRYTILPEKVLQHLRLYWESYHPGQWLFPARNRSRHMLEGTAQKIFYAAKKKAGVTKGRGIHTLRHCFASHLHEAGYDIYTIKRIMGHNSFSTTAKYLHFNPDRIKTIRSPLEDVLSA